MPTPINDWLRQFQPSAAQVTRREIALSAFGAGLGLWLTYWVSQFFLAGINPWFVAPMGASAVLLFAVPASPLAQPWSIVGGNTVAACVGVACAAFIPDQALAVACAGALAIALMFSLRCLHPPSGAIALTAVLGGPAVQQLGFYFVLTPVLVNSLLLLAVALVLNPLMGRRYPHGPHTVLAQPHATQDALPSTRLGLTRQDWAAALQAHGDMLDISLDDLNEVFAQAERQAYSRRFGDIRCADIMSHDVVTITPSEPASLAWQRMRHHAIKALPVVNELRQVVGIVTLHDFLMQPLNAAASSQVSTQSLMTQPVDTAQAAQSIVDLIPLFSDGGRHHLPVVNAQGVLVGMLTQSDMVAALFHAGLEQPARVF